MIFDISETDIKRLIDTSVNTLFGARIAQAVSEHFRSMHYVSSKNIYNGVALNLLLNTKITPTSADGIITMMRRSNKSLYTNIESAYFPIEDKFAEYAKSILQEDYESVIKLNMRPANFIIYVISLDLFENAQLNIDEVFRLTYSYQEFLDGKVPQRK